MEVTIQIGVTDTGEITLKLVNGVMEMLDNTKINTLDTLDTKEIITHHLTANPVIQFMDGEIMLESPTSLLDPTSSLLEEAISKLLIINY